MRISSLVACIGAAPLLMAAAQPVRLEPSSSWVIDYAEDSCRLIRVFGTDKNETKLVFESSAPDQMDMLVIGRPLVTYEEQVPATFLPVAGKTFEGTVAVTVTKGDPAILWPNIPMLPPDLLAQLDKERQLRKLNPGVRPPAISVAEQQSRKAQRHQFAAAATELEIQTRPNRPVILETGRLDDAIAAFDKCSEDSLKDWGVDPAVEAKIVRPVWTENPTKWFFASDYPPDMLRSGKESQVEVRLLVDATGKITKCTSLSHFKEAEFNRITCDAVTRRARFEPAELADGTKVPSYYTQRIIFRIAH